MTKPSENKQEKTVGARSRDVGQSVRRLREEKGLSGAGLCRRDRGIAPKTLVALEKGRIRKPSITTLEALVKGLGNTVSDLFRTGELADKKTFHLGTQKGAFLLDLPQQGIQLISFTPLAEESFCEKRIFESGRHFDSSSTVGDFLRAFF